RETTPLKCSNHGNPSTLSSVGEHYLLIGKLIRRFRILCRRLPMDPRNLLDLYTEKNRSRFLALSFALITIIALIDWQVNSNAGLGFFYAIPIFLAAVYLRVRHIFLLGLLCALLREVFSSFNLGFESIPRSASVAVTFWMIGLLVRELTRSRKADMESLR